jgi:type I site-specific restriction-modification system R (restriction) subunit
VIILDDTHRSEYQTLLAKLRDQGYKTLTFFGPKPTSIIEAQSTIIYRTDNALGI